MSEMDEGPGQVAVPSESRGDVSVHGLWKRGTTSMFDMKRILQRWRKKRRTNTFRISWSVGVILLQLSNLHMEFPERRP